jgi:hypothetical protein
MIADGDRAPSGTRGAVELPTSDQIPWANARSLRTMATETDRRTMRQRQILDELIQKRGLLGDEYALFLVAGEGRFFPATSRWAEIEESSGFVLDKRGRVFMFWLGWDAERQGPGLTDWEEVEPEPHWGKASEYQKARQKVGLPAA